MMILQKRQTANSHTKKPAVDTAGSVVHLNGSNEKKYEVHRLPIYIYTKVDAKLKTVHGCSKGLA